MRSKPPRPVTIFLPDSLRENILVKKTNSLMTPKDYPLRGGITDTTKEPPRDYEIPNWENMIYFCLASFSVVVGVSELYLFRNYMVDDAFISLRYVKNALKGNGLVYNIGERVEGFTSPLHILINFVQGAMGLDLVLASKIAGVISLLLIVSAVAIWSSSRKNPYKMNPPERCLVICLVATSFPLTFFAITGMETVLFSLLTLLIFLDATRLKITFRFTFLIFLAFLCRPEGITFLFGIISGVFFIRWLGHDQGNTTYERILFFDHKEILALVILALAVITFLGLRWNYYGEILPNTFFAKAPWSVAAETFHWSLKGIRSIIYFFSQSGGIIGIIIFMAAIFRKDRYFNVLVMVAAVTLSLMLFQKYAGSDWMIGSRYFIPALPVWAIGLGICFVNLGILDACSSSFSRCIVVSIAVLIIATMNIAEASQFLKNIRDYPNNVQSSIELKDVGNWIQNNLPREYQVRNWRIGAIGYYCDNPIIDTWGLVDREIARLRFHVSSEDEGNKLVQSAIQKRNPEVIITKLYPGILSDEKNYSLVHEGKNGNETLGVWVRRDLLPNLKVKPIRQQSSNSPGQLQETQE